MIAENGNRLRILVQASGHINFAEEMNTDQKGLWHLSHNQEGILKWKMYKFPIDEKILSWKQTENNDEFPTLYHA